MVNAWRNVSEEHPIMDNALACCDCASVDLPGDFVRCDVELQKRPSLNPDGEDQAVPPAEQYRLAARGSGRHRWCYFPRMERDEVLLFKQFDSDPAARARFCFHSSFSDLAAATAAPPRRSVEVRCIAFFPDPQPYAAPAVAEPEPAAPAAAPTPAPNDCGCKNAATPTTHAHRLAGAAVAVAGARTRVTRTTRARRRVDAAAAGVGARTRTTRTIRASLLAGAAAAPPRPFRPLPCSRSG